MSMFQSTPLREGRLCFNKILDIFVKFQSTPLREGRPNADGTPVINKKFQSTPLHEGRRAIGYCVLCLFLVSIHAPARGATHLYTWTLSPCPVSIHAPARGATNSTIHIQLENMFQSTPLREGRRMRESRRSRHRSFNPRPCARGDLTCLTILHLVSVSIHAPARGATDIQGWDISECKRFNPRPCARGDHSLGLGRGGHAVSIHAPARGATAAMYRACCAKHVSIHAPARGATASKQSSRIKVSVSIHAPARGATQSSTPIHCHIACFNPRPCARGDYNH